MPCTSHLKSLQALDMAIREGSLKAAADRLGITPAAVGQRIRALEEYLGTDLLLRGRSGLTPTPEVDRALPDLRQAFDALDRVTEMLDFQRVSEIHIVADADWAELWLMPRLASFRAEYPNILFCINGSGDVPLRLGAPDLRIVYGEELGEPLYHDVIVPVTGPDNVRRIAGSERFIQMEGMPLLHMKSHYEGSAHPGWVEWFAAFGHRDKGTDRGVRYGNARLALEAVRQNVGFLVCGLSLLLLELEAGSVVLPFSLSERLASPHPYRLRTRADSAQRPQIQRFIGWMHAEADDTVRKMSKLTG
jgi:LysR family transcriptional regulator, glycine cleavage system transcriptional activator